MTSIGQLEDQVGELLARHDRGRSVVEFRKYRKPRLDLVGFMENELHMELTPPEEEIARAFEEGDRVVVRGPNGLGKDHVTAGLALAWTYVMRGFSMISGPTLRQTKIVMREIRSAWEGADGLPGELFETALWVDKSRPSGILAFTSTEVGRLTGFHAPGGLAVFLTEAHATGEDVFEAALANTTGEHSRILSTGNPISKASRFYRCFQTEGWTKLGFSAWDHPNVQEGREIIPGAITRGFVKRIEQEFGKSSPQYAYRVAGEFPESEVGALTTWAALEEAQAKHEEGTLHDAARDKGFVIGLDVGHEGEDLTVAAIRQGPVVRRLVTWRHATTSETVRKVKRLVISLVAGRSERLERGVDVVVDASGVGAGVHDDLAELDLTYLRVHKFKSSFSAEEPDLYYQLRDECYWKLRNLLRKLRIALPRDPELAEELTEMRWESGPRDTIKMESKSGSGGLTSRLGRSPDRADAVSMSLARDAAVSGVHLRGGYDDDAPEGWELLGPPVASGQIPLH